MTAPVEPIALDNQVSGTGASGSEKARILLQTPLGRSALTSRVLLKTLKRFRHMFTLGRLAITLPNDDVLQISGDAGGPDAAMRLHRWRVFRRATSRGDVGLGEAFMDGDWDSPDLSQLLLFFAVNAVESGEQFAPRGVAGLLLALAHALRGNSIRKAPHNITKHYDMGNDFYATWLDPSMTYSAALFANKTSDLEAAQKHKYHSLIQSVGIGANDHVLEVGCGWGGFACEVVRHTGCRVTAITLSRAQFDYAKRRVKSEGLDDRITVVLQDYREVAGTFDRIVSIEMIEAVGEEYWPTYFNKIATLLRPGGTFGLQAITIKDAVFPDYRKTADFLQTYIFPGGMLLPENGIQNLAADAGFEPVAFLAFGLDYARTLISWRDRFDAAWPEIVEQGFDTRFQRMWQFYLAECEAGFRSGLIDVSQTVFRLAPPLQPMDKA